MLQIQFIDAYCSRIHVYVYKARSCIAFYPPTIKATSAERRNDLAAALSFAAYVYIALFPVLLRECLFSRRAVQLLGFLLERVIGSFRVTLQRELVFARSVLVCRRLTSGMQFGEISGNYITLPLPLVLLSNYICIRVFPCTLRVVGA